MACGRGVERAWLSVGDDPCQRLEALVGHMLVARSKGGGVDLTAHGQELVERGRALLALNDEILRSLHAQPTHGAVRLGVDEGYTRRCLPDILARFAVTHPQTTVEVLPRHANSSRD